MSEQAVFNLSSEELALSEELSTIIRQEIESSGGVIAFSRYMELALYYPQLGYYSNPLFKFGASGDFVTAPLISNLFGHLISRQLSELFSFGVAANILEFGAGNGKLAADILSTLGEQIEHYYILELSADLRACQEEMLRQKVPEFMSKVVWLNQLPSNFNGIMLANEVLDAQPCNLLRFEGKKITGVGVTVAGDGFKYHDYRLDNESLHVAQQLNLDYEDYLSEVNLASRGFMRSLGENLQHGAILLIDYGYGETEYYHPQKKFGTLRAFHRQQVLDQVLLYPGLCDITASVNWSSIATTAIEHGLDFIGYTTQAAFLFNCGLSEVMAELHTNLDDAKYLQLSNQVNRLISPNEMGSSFKVCGFSKGLQNDSWRGFDSHDLSYTL